VLLDFSREGPPGGGSHLGGAAWEVGRVVGAGADIQCNKSGKPDWMGRISSGVADMLATHGGGIVMGRVECLVLFIDCSERAGQGVELCCDGPDAGDGGAYEGQGTAFARCDGLEGMAGHVLD